MKVQERGTVVRQRGEGVRVTDHARVRATVGASRDASDLDQCVPMIVLRGRWLSRMGLQPGVRLRIAASHGRIVITLLDPPEPPPPAMPVNFRKYQRERPRRVFKQTDHPP